MGVRRPRLPTWCLPSSSSPRRRGSRRATVSTP